MSEFFEMLIGVTIVADALAVAVACAKTEDVNKIPRRQKLIVSTFFIVRNINNYLVIKNLVEYYLSGQMYKQPCYVI